VTVRLRRSGVVVGTQNVSVPRNATVPVNFTYSMDSVGFNDISVTADALSGETLTADNAAHVTVRVWDLTEAISADSRTIYLNTTSVNAGENFTVYVPVQNSFSDVEFKDMHFSLIVPPGYTVFNNTQTLDLLPGDNQLLVWTVQSGSTGTGTVMVSVESDNTVFVPENIIVN
jgi:hypothetical protein